LKVSFLSIQYYGQKNIAHFLDKSGFCVEKVIVSNIDELKEKAIEIYEINKEETFIVFRTDIELYELSRSKLTPDQRKFILPARNSDGVNILGSKVGLYKHLKHFDIPHPRTEIAVDSEELNQLSKAFDFPIFIKADVGAGGQSVERFTSLGQLQKKGINQSWFPVAIQQEISSKEVSVEAAYFNGQLLFWAYSEIVETEARFAPSMTRKYLNPEDRKFIKILTELGASASLHGFVNGTFLIGPENEYLLIEADIRPNAWHHLYYQFGIDIYGLANLASQGKTVIPQYPRDLPKSGLIIKHKARHIFKAVNDRKYFRILLIGLDSSFFHKKNWAITADSDQLQIIVFTKVMAYMFAVICVRALPSNLRLWLRENQFTARFVGKLLS
jgi:hypothetical protein